MRAQRVQKQTRHSEDWWARSPAFWRHLQAHVLALHRPGRGDLRLPGLLAVRNAHGVQHGACVAGNRCGACVADWLAPHRLASPRAPGAFCEPKGPRLRTGGVPRARHAIPHSLTLKGQVTLGCPLTRLAFFFTTTGRDLVAVHHRRRCASPTTQADAGSGKFVQSVNTFMLCALR